MRRMAVGKILWAQKCWLKASAHQKIHAQCERYCTWNLDGEEPVANQEIIAYFIEALA